MNAKVLIDALVHQTTILIAQLSTAAGIRAPLAHIADQVFLELSREIESQGVSRKIAADMFGMAIRAYQKKVQRLTASITNRDKTLWQLVLEHLQAEGSMPRRKLLLHFRREDPDALGSVVNDLVSSGLVYKTGTGEAAILGVTRDRDLEQSRQEAGRESLGPIIWIMIYRAGSATRGLLSAQLSVEPLELDAALEELVDEGRVTRSGEGDAETFTASTVVVPLDAEHGWEAAVFDHYQAMVRAIGSKVRHGRARSNEADVIGGATLTFDVSATHPLREEALGLLRRVRAEANELWNQVQAYNEAHPLAEEEKVEVFFYFGQSVATLDEE